MYAMLVSMLIAASLAGGVVGYAAVSLAERQQASLLRDVERMPYVEPAPSPKPQSDRIVL